MKRTKFAAALAVLTLLTTLTGCGQAKEADGALEPVTLNEVAHSIFYAPQYAAIELGYFKDEGIALTLVNGAISLGFKGGGEGLELDRVIRVITRKRRRCQPEIDTLIDGQVIFWIDAIFL